MKSKESDVTYFHNKRYKVEMGEDVVLGKGAFSLVLAAIDTQTNDLVAIKICKKEKHRFRFLEEVRVLQKLQGPGIPELYDFGRDGSWMCIQRLGKSLSKAVRLLRKVELPKQQVKNQVDKWFIEMLERLKFIHTVGFVHRDIKPDNFVVEIENPKKVYLVDFGFCKPIKQSLRESGHFVGTSKYASVAALRGEPQSRASDLESLLYSYAQMSKGKLPWDEYKKRGSLRGYMELADYKQKCSAKKIFGKKRAEFCSYLLCYVKHLKCNEIPDYTQIILMVKQYTGLR